MFLGFRHLLIGWKLGAAACGEIQADQALGPEGAIGPGSFRKTEAKLWGEKIHMAFSSSLCWISGFTSL